MPARRGQTSQHQSCRKCVPLCEPPSLGCFVMTQTEPTETFIKGGFMDAAFILWIITQCSLFYSSHCSRFSCWALLQSVPLSLCHTPITVCAHRHALPSSWHCKVLQAHPVYSCPSPSFTLSTGALVSFIGEWY